MGSVANWVMDDVLGMDLSDDAAKAASAAANTQASWQKEALDYLKQTEQLPQQFREGALKTLGGLYGLEGGQGSQQELIDQAKQSPLYQAIMGTKRAGEDSVLRNAAATGGLRSGNVQRALYDYNTQLENKALLDSYNQQLQGLTGLANLPSNANNIANAMGDIGQTLSQGQVARAQIQQQGSQQNMQNLMGLASGAAMLFSDCRLKGDIKFLGKVGPFNWYSWDWNKLANLLGLKGFCQGVIADEVIKTNPEAVSYKNGYMIVNYTTLGVM